MKYQEVLEEVLLSLEGQRMEEIIKRIRKKTKTRKKDKAIIKDIEKFLYDDKNPMVSDAVYDEENCDWIYRSDVFAEMAFLVRINDYEWENKVLVLGHRIVPFMNISKINSGDIKLFSEEGNELPFVRKELDLENGLAFMSLMPPYTTEGFIDFGEDGIRFDTYDLSSFINNSGFEKGDLLEFFPKDYGKNEFFVSRKTAKKSKREAIAMNRREDMLSFAVEDVLAAQEMDGGILDYVLFQAFALVKDELGGHAGFPIAQMVNQWSEAELFYINSTAAGVALIFNDDPMELAMDMMGDDSMDMKIMGNDGSLDGILEDIGNSYREDFVTIDFILQLHKADGIDVEKTLESLFKGKSPIHYVASEIEELKEKLLELKPEIAEDWKGVRLSADKQEFVEIGHQAKQKIVGILRELDARFLMPQDLNMDKMRPLLEIESIVDMLFEVVIQSKKIPGVFAKQLKEPFKQLLIVLDEMKEDILADFD